MTSYFSFSNVYFKTKSSSPDDTSISQIESQSHPNGINNVNSSNNIAGHSSENQIQSKNITNDSNRNFNQIDGLDEIHEDFFVKFIKNYYFPFQLRFHKVILVLWLIILVISAIFGLTFLTLTKSSLDLPPTAPSVKAINAYADLYPDASTWAPTIILQNLNTNPATGSPYYPSIINQATYNFSQSLKTHVQGEEDIIQFISGYWEQINLTDGQVRAKASVSPSNTTMLTKIIYQPHINEEEVNQNVKDLIDFAKQSSVPSTYIATTGLSALFIEMEEYTAQAFLFIDATVLPICIVILGLNVRSYRHMLIAFANLICTLLLAFALLVPVAHATNINPFSPSIMMSLGIAVCFDYTLFMINRFKEEMVLKHRTRLDAVYFSLAAAGHVIIVSGMILLCTFLLLISFPQTFLQSVGITCATIVFTSMLTNMTLAPALLITFECFGRFEIIPNSQSVCCWVSKDQLAREKLMQAENGDDYVIVKNTNYSNGDDSDGNNTTGNNINNANNNTNNVICLDTTTNSTSTTSFINYFSNYYSSISSTIVPSTSTTTTADTPRTTTTNHGVTIANAAANVDNTNNTSNTTITTADAIVNSSTTTNNTTNTDNNNKYINTNKNKTTEKPHHGFFFQLAYWITKHPWFTLLITGAVTAPLLWQLTLIEPTSDLALIFLPGSRSLDAYELMQQEFPVGLIDPYIIIVNVENKPNTVFTADYFTLEKQLISELLLVNAPKYINTKSITAISYYNGNTISYELATAYKNISSPLYSTQAASDYRGSTVGYMNTNQEASTIKIETLVDPNSQEIVQFILDTRDVLTNFHKTNTYPYVNNITNSIENIPIDTYLFGGYTTTYDLQVIVYELVPIMVGVTIAAVMILVAFSFGSIALTLRLLLTVCLSLCWAYGFMVIVYQPGNGQDAFAKLTPSISNSSGIYWLIPIMSFSILIGLALDYDIFLMSRMVEFRRYGWSDNASICLAVEKTGGIITAAGLIMSISFAGLLILDVIVLNQYGLALFLGVIFDTFIIRPIVVPAVVAAFGGNTDAFWYPTLMPSVSLTPAEEESALLLGLWHPVQYTNNLKLKLLKNNISGNDCSDNSNDNANNNSEGDVNIVSRCEVVAVVDDDHDDNNSYNNHQEVMVYHNDDEHKDNELKSKTIDSSNDDFAV